MEEIQKALEHLEKANYAGYFREIDKIVIPYELKTAYASLQKDFIDAGASWKDRDRMEVFARALKNVATKTKDQIINLPVFPSKTDFFGKIKRFFDWDKTYWRSVENPFKDFNATTIQNDLKAYLCPAQTELKYGKGNENPYVKLAEFCENLSAEDLKDLQKMQVDKFVLKAFLNQNTPHLVVLGESGIGKTVFLQKIFLDYARTSPAYDLAFVYASGQTLEQIESIENPQNTVLFIDALDEDAESRKDFEGQKTKLQNLFAQKQFKKNCIKKFGLC